MISKNDLFKICIENSMLFIIYGFIYYLIESIYKYPAESHWTMFVVGGCMGVVIGGLNNYLPWEMPFWRQCFYGSIIITATEGISGLILNKILNLNVWDYSHVPLNFFFEQCSIPFCIAWLFLAGFAIIIDDWLREKLFDEKRQKYHLF